MSDTAVLALVLVGCGVFVLTFAIGMFFIPRHPKRHPRSDRWGLSHRGSIV